jgi:hypothetical protein
MNKTTTAYLLCKSFGDDFIPDIPVLIDYWGKNIDDDEITSIIYGVYKGLYRKGITADLFHKCFLANKLDELIHKKYKHNSSGYYREFVKKNIIIGKTYYDLRASEDKNDDSDIEEFEILDDNTCPSCYSENYYTQNYIKNAPPDCAICCKMICKICSYYDDKECSNVCYQCNTSSLKNNIQRKLARYKKSDIDSFGREGTVSIDDISKLLKKQNFTCYVCNEMVITSKWKPFCCYQFSVDRINNNLPHDKNNVLISCYYCNCRHHFEFNQKNKICNEGCHTQPKNIISRKQVDKEKINSLLLQ